jgi:aryl-alcohol dehydrogenase-like predicted oxidoreductase
LQKFEDFAANDIRRRFPRFQGENFQKNVDLVNKIQEIATEKNVTASQMALAWVIANGALPIPGTKRVKYVQELLILN